LQMRPEFASNLRRELRGRAFQEAPRPAVRPAALLAVAACLVLAMVVVLSVVRRPATEERALRAAMTEISRQAVDDHRDCAVDFRLPKRPIPLEEAGSKYDRAYLNLADVVSSRVALSGGVELVESHSCVFNGRRFAHIILRQRGNLISLLVTDLSRPGDATRSPSDANQQVSACPQFEGYQVACFETERHAIFVVSDLAENDNLAIARQLAPSVRSHISQAEGPA
ncbi:MAG: hypothetical protein ACREDR_48680, partial [Blastocatellia bacterium]